MVEFLRKTFIKDYQNIKDPSVRKAHGKLASLVGVISNCFLFCVKLVIGLISGSIAMIADGINNLSDMGSSVITLVGFKLASAPADKEHPYGHQRIEYIAGLIVSMIIIFVGGNLFFPLSIKSFIMKWNRFPTRFFGYPSVFFLCLYWLKCGSRILIKNRQSSSIGGLMCDGRRQP